MDLNNADFVNQILTDTAKSIGLEVRQEVIQATSQVLAETNETVDLVSQSDSKDLDKVLAMIKAANQTNIKDSIQELVRGEKKC